MKKNLFSAVALVAFSFAGMANTGGEEKIELNNYNSNKELKTFIPYCMLYAITNASIESADQQVSTGSLYSDSQFMEAFSFYSNLCNNNDEAVGNVTIVRGM